MGLETFPEIESFQKLPRQVIVKGGESSFSKESGARLNGIVINNSGHGIRMVRAHVVIFDENQIPLLNTSIEVDPAELAQGGIGSFVFHFQELEEDICDYHLYTTWKFSEAG